MAAHRRCRAGWAEAKGGAKSGATATAQQTTRPMRPARNIRPPRRRSGRICAAGSTVQPRAQTQFAGSESLAIQPAGLPASVRRSEQKEILAMADSQVTLTFPDG